MSHNPDNIHLPEMPMPPQPPPEDEGLCSNHACPCHRPLSPWAQEIVDRCKAEGRKATEAEQFVLYAELALLAERAIAALGGLDD